MLLGRQQYFVRRRDDGVKLVGTHDILEAENQERIGLAKEEPPTWIKLPGFLVNKQI